MSPRATPCPRGSTPQAVPVTVDDDGRTPGACQILGAVMEDEAGFAADVSLCAFENTLSDTARRAQSSLLSDRYLIGTLAERGREAAPMRAGFLYSAMPAVARLEHRAERVACAMFGARHVEFRPLSGLHATICTLATLTRPGDLVYSIDPADGGHFATQRLLHLLGRGSSYLPWNRAAHVPDIAALARTWRERPGRLLLLDHGTPLVPLPVAAIRDVIGSRAVLVYDGSHTLGLIAGGEFQDPLREGCDVLQGNTHKSFPGAHKGLILFADDATGRAVSDEIGAALVSSQNTGGTIANLVTVLEMAEHGRRYARAMVANARLLAAALEDRRFALVQPGSEPRSHVLLIAGHPRATGYDLAHRLLQAGIRVNARPVGGQVVVRIGTQEITRRGCTADDLGLLAEVMSLAAQGGSAARTRKIARGLAKRWNRVHFSFDGHG